MEIPLELERRLERRWAARFSRTRRIALEGGMPRLAKANIRWVARDREPENPVVWKASGSRGCLKRIDQRDLAGNGFVR